MSDFHERWMNLAAAARRVGVPPAELTPGRSAELARLACRQPAAGPEWRSLLALAALLACVLLALVPWQEQVADFVAGAARELAALPARVPRPPRPPSGAAALAALLELPPFTTESQP
jgi:hypothetical protein